MRVVKTLTHRDAILSPFVMKKASEDLNEERERQRLREESSSQSTTPTRTGKRGFGGLDVESIAQAKTLHASNKKARVSFAKKQSPDKRDNNGTARAQRRLDFGNGRQLDDKPSKSSDLSNAEFSQGFDL